MDKELIFYIVFGLIYLISRASRKKKQKQAQQAPPQAQPPKGSSPARPMTPVSQGSQPKEQPDAPLSFEDILKELTGDSRKTVEQPIPEPEPEPASVLRTPAVKPEPANPWESETLEQPVLETIPEYTFSNQDKNTSDASDLWSQYQNTGKGQAGYRKTILEEIEDDRRDYKFSAYVEDVSESDLTAGIRKMLEDKEDIKKAVVLSEILKTKF